MFLIPVAIVILVSTLIVLYRRKKQEGLPPGPRGLPVLGYAPFLGKNPQDVLLELGKTYGNIFSIYMGPRLAVVLNDFEAIRAAYQDQAEIFTGRPDGFVFTTMSTGSDGHIHGIAQAEGDLWKTTRRFALQTLRDLGMGKSAIQDRILEEAEHLIEDFQKKAGQAFNPDLPLMSSINNVICSLCFGKRFPQEDPTMRSLMTDVSTIAVFLAQAGPLQAYPFLRFLPTKLGQRWKNFMTALDAVHRFFRREIGVLRAEQAEDEPRNYTDAFLQKQKKEESTINGQLPGTSPFSDEELIGNVRAFFGAGTETTCVTLLWIFLYMLHHPDVQQKVQAELDDKVGRHRSVTVDDRVNVPYVEAVIRECQRLGNVSPFGILRTNTQETTLLGFRIPKRTYIMPNYLSVNRDPKLWEQPGEFRPQRFLSQSGTPQEPSYFIPFSLGKRACVGEALARMELFLIFANIMHRFTLLPAKDYPLPPTKQYATGISCRPSPFHMKAEFRT